jgi:hypothetical protein
MAPNDPDMDAVLNSAASPPMSTGGIDPDMDAVLAKVPNAPQTAASRAPAPNRTFGEKAIGAGEAALAFGTSLLARIPEAAAGAANLISNIGLSPEEVRERASRYPTAGQSFEPYQPRTAAGREYLGDIGEAIDASKLAVPLPELAMLPTRVAPALEQPVSQTLGQTARSVLPGAKPTVAAPFSSVSLSPRVAAAATPASGAVASTGAGAVAAPISQAVAAAAPQTEITGALRRAAQTLIDESGLPADQLSARLRTASAATPSSLPPTTGNLIGGKVASLEKALRGDADVKDVLTDADTQRTQAQLANISGRFGGSDQDLLNLKNARSANSAAWTGEGGYLNNPDLKVDATPIIEQINASLKSPIGRDIAANKGLKSVLSDIDEIAPDGQIDIGNLDAIRQKLRDTIAQHTTTGVVGSKTNIGLNPIRDAITNQIESAVPGYRDYLAQYAADSKRINTMEAANSFRDWTGGRPLVDPDGTPSINYQQTAKQLKEILEREGGVDPELENAVNAMHQDMRRGTVVAMSQRQAGSDTLANISAKSRLERATAGGIRLLPQGVVPQVAGEFAKGVVSNVASAAALQTKQGLARMMADPRFAADVIDSMGPK